MNLVKGLFLLGVAFVMLAVAMVAAPVAWVAQRRSANA